MVYDTARLMVTGTLDPRSREVLEPTNSLLILATNTAPQRRHQRFLLLTLVDITPQPRHRLMLSFVETLPLVKGFFGHLPLPFLRAG